MEYPTEVYRRAHRDYPEACASANVYCAAFFGHSLPTGVKKTPESVWKGLLRRHWLRYQYQGGN